MADSAPTDSGTPSGDAVGFVPTAPPDEGFAYRYHPDELTTAAQIVTDPEWAGLEPDDFETGERGKVRLAGRLMLRRGQGKVVFGVLQDGSGTAVEVEPHDAGDEVDGVDAAVRTDRVQLLAQAGNAEQGQPPTEDFDSFKKLNIGDWIGVEGTVGTTKRGQLSVRVDSWGLLASTHIGFPDKFHGIGDPDLRYRQRYVDLWVTPEAADGFRMRSAIMSGTRRFLEDREFIEVETPIFHPIPGGAAARPFTTYHNALDLELYLRVAPELYLKRLIVGGLPRVFELARVFRNEGLSTRHNPEFTMLELYQAYADYTDMMEITESLVTHLAEELTGSLVVDTDGRALDLSGPWPRRKLADLVSEAVGRGVGIETPIAELRTLCDTHAVAHTDADGPGKLLLELYEKLVEHTLWDPTFVTDYPIEVSPLSREHRSEAGLVERFELIVAGRELANAFSELADPDEQRRRFEAQALLAEAGDDEAMVVDADYLRALSYGMPPAGGLGIGMDRLVMLLIGTTTIRDVILFPTLRPEQG